MTAATAPRYHFITGLPRAGSTLLSALLLRNPRFHAGMTSPVGGLFRGMLNQLGAGSEFGPVVTTEQRRRLARGLFDSYYADQAGNKDMIFETKRRWRAKIHALMDLYTGSKPIACVHNVAWVMDSIERRVLDTLYQKLLCRLPHEAGKAYWLGQLAGGTTRGEVVAGFAQSGEYQELMHEEVSVTLFYVGLLGCTPDKSGSEHWLHVLNNQCDALRAIDAFAQSHRFLPSDGGPAGLVGLVSTATTALLVNGSR